MANKDIYPIKIDYPKGMVTNIELPPEKLHQFKYNLNTRETFYKEMDNRGLQAYIRQDLDEGWDVCLFYHKGCFWLSGGISAEKEKAELSLRARLAAFRGIMAI